MSLCWYPAEKSLEKAFGKLGLGMGGRGKRTPQKQQEWEAKVSGVVAGNGLLPPVFEGGREQAPSRHISIPALFVRIA